MKKLNRHTSLLIAIITAAAILVGVLWYATAYGLLPRTSENYRIETDILNLGGTTNESSANYINFGSFGEPFIGGAASESYIIFGGFFETNYLTPEAPASLSQYLSDGVTTIEIAERIDEGSIVIKFNVFDNDNPDTLTPYIELRLTSESFTNSANFTGEALSFLGITLEAVVTVEGLSPGEYHWQAIQKDAFGAYSSWISFGGNSEYESDFTVRGPSWIRGTITVSSEADNSGALVEAFYEGRLYGTDETDAAGDYEIQVLNGSIEIEATKKGFGLEVYDSVIDAPLNGTVESVDITIYRAWYKHAQDRWNSGASPDLSIVAPLALKWSFNANNKSIVGSSAIKDGIVYFGSKDNKLYALNASTGAFVWSYQANYWTNCSPAVYDGKVFFNTTLRELFALNASTGAFAWSYRIGSIWFSSSSGPHPARGIIYIGNSDSNTPTGRMHAIRASDGAFLWSFKGTNFNESNCPVIDGNNLYYMSAGTSAIVGKFYNIDPETGLEKWAYDVNGSCAYGIANYQERFFGVHANSLIFALNKSDGSYAWSFTVGEQVNFSKPAVTNDIIYAGSSDNRFYALDDSQDGVFLWSFVSGNQIQNSPVAANNVVWFGSLDGSVYGLSTSEGTMLWSFNTGSYVYSAPTILNGQLFVGDGNGYFYAFENNTTPEAILNLQQFKSDLTTELSTGEITSEDTVVIKFTMDDQNGMDTLYPEIEIKLTSESFTDLPTSTGEGVARNGTSVTGIITVEGLADGQYHWQARARDPQGRTSPWLAFGGNAENDTDFEISFIGWIKGTVTLSGESDHSDILVEAFKNGAVYGHATTETNGDYLIAITQGTYELEAIKTGFSHKTYSISFEVTAGSTVENIDLAISRSWHTYNQNWWNTGDSDDLILSPPLAFKWKFNAGAGVSFPIVEEGVVYFVANKTIEAVDIYSHELLWSYSINFPVIGSLSIANGKVFAAVFDNVSGPVFCLDSSSGSLIWSYWTGGSCRSAPLVASGRVYVSGGPGNTSTYIYSLDEKTGSFYWSFRSRGGTIHINPSIDTVNRELYVTDGSGYVYAVDVLDGSMKWSSLPVAGSQRGSPVIDLENRRLYSGCGDNIVAYDVSSNGSFLWSFNTGGLERSGPILAKGMVYAGSFDNNIYAINAETGSFVWSYDSGYNVEAEPARANDAIYTLFTNKYIHVIDDETGASVWSFEDDGPFYTGPAIVDGNLYAGSSDGTLYVFENGSSPNKPPQDTLKQYKTDGITEIATGEWTNENSLIFKFEMSDPNGYEYLYAEVEVKPTTESFDETITATGAAQYYSGSPITGVVTVSSISSDTGYHWRARIRDQQNMVSSWEVFAGNLETDIDFKVDAIPPEVTVLTPILDEIINGGETYEVTWILTEEGGSGLIADPIDLYYSTDEGASWIEIATEEADDGLYIWDVPIINSSTCLISVEAEDNVGHIGRNINGVFEISGDGWVSGTVTLSGESDHSGVRVEAFDDGTLVATTETDINGDYSMQVLAGVHNVEVGIGGYQQSIVSIEVTTSATTENVDFLLFKGWPQMQQDRWRTGASPDKDLYPAFSLKWSYYVGLNTPIQSDIKIEKGNVYFAASDGLHSLTETGEFRWSFGVGFDIAFGASVQNDKVFATFTVNAGTTYHLICVSAESGNLLWSSDNYSSVYMNGRPLVYGGQVYAATELDKQVRAWDFDGNFKWGTVLPDFIEGRNYAAAADGITYWPAYDGKMYALDSGDGSIKWSFQGGTRASSPLIHNNRIVFGSVAKRLFVYDKDTGSFIWSYQTSDWIFGGITPAEGNYYFGDLDNAVYCIDESGSFQWSFVGIGQIRTAPTYANGVIYSISGSRAYALKADDGTVLWSYIGSDFKEGVSVYNKKLFMPHSTSLYVFENNSTPESVTELEQYKSDLTTTITTGEWTGEDTVVFKFTMDDENGIDILYPEVEIKLTSESFTGIVTATGEGVDRSATPGAAVTGIVTIEGIASGDYHWQARSRDPQGWVSPWQSFGGNPETEPDFKSDPISPEVTILSPISAEVINGGTTYEVTWIVTDEGSGLITDPINIYYSTDEGSSWIELATEEANDGLYIWDVPVINSNTYLISIEAEDNVGHIGRDVSPSFEIFGDGWINGMIALDGEVDHSRVLVEAFIRGEFYATAETEADGSYEMKILTGTYSIEARNHGYSTAVYSGSVYVGAGGTIESVDLTLYKGWPQFRQDQHLTGASPARQMQLPLSVKWVYNWGNIERSPIYADNKVFLSGNNGQIRAINGNNGTLVWSYYPGAGSASYSSPCYYNDLVYYNAYNKMICLSANTGSFIWSYNYNALSSRASPAVHRGIVYFGAGVSGDTYSSRFFALDAYTGALVWSYPVKSLYVDRTPILDGDNLYFGNSAGVGAEERVNLDPGTGAEKWTLSKSGASLYGYSFKDNKIIGLSPDGANSRGLLSAGKTDGASSFYWTFYTDNAWYEWYQVPAVSGETVYVGSSNNNFYAIDINNGSFIWSYNAGNQILCSPAIENGMIFFTSKNNEAIVLSATDGSLLWSYPVASAQFETMSPIIVNGSAYVPSYHQKLYAFYTNSTPEVDASTIMQYKSDLTTEIPTGEWTNEDTVVFKAEASDPDYADILYLQVEIKLTNEAFDETNIITGEGFSWLRGNTLEVIVTAEGISDSAIGYHWRLRCIDQYSFPSAWYVFGGNAEDENDFRLDANAPDITVITPVSAEVIYGDATYEVTWILTEESGSELIADPVSLYYSTDEGLSWIEIATGEADDSSYVWDVPALTSSPIFISIEAEDNIGNIGLASSNPFDIYGDGWISGTITLSPDASVSVEVVAYQDGLVKGWAIINGSGSYLISGLLAGTYSYEASSMGYEVLQGGSLEVSVNSTSEGNDLVLGRSWPMYKQDKRGTSYSPDTILYPPLVMKWSFNVGDIWYSSPTVHNDRVYMSTYDGALFCLTTDGEFKWNYDVGGGVNYSSPAIYNGVIYFGATDSRFYAIRDNGENGSLEWSFNAGGIIRSSPLVANGMVYFGTMYGIPDSQVFALTENGEFKWSFSIAGNLSQSLSKIGDTIYFGCDDFVLYALKDDGTLKWSYMAVEKIFSAPLLSDGNVYFGDYVVVLNAMSQDGTYLWSYDAGEPEAATASSPSGFNGAIYIGSVGKRVFRIDNNGSFVWSYVTAASYGVGTRTSPTIANGVVYFGSTCNNLYALGSDSGNLLWSFYTGDSVDSSASVLNGMLFVGSDNGNVYAFENNITPESPSNLMQYESDLTTEIATGEWINESTVVFKFEMTDSNFSDVLYPELEIKSTAESFDGIISITGEGINSSSDVPVTAIITYESLSINTKYHWRARVRDSAGIVSSWVSFGGNPETNTDFEVRGPGWIRGYVDLVDENDDSGAIVEAYVLGKMFATAESAADGSYTLYIMSGTYSVEATKKGFEIDGYDGPITVNADSTIESINITLGKAWPMFHQDLHRSGNSPEKKLAPPLSFKWVYDAGITINSSPIVAEGKVYFTAQNNIYAVDAYDGTMQWSHTYGPSYLQIPKSLCYYKGVIFAQRPYISAGNISGALYAVDASSGSFKWSYYFGFINVYTGIPTAARGLVYCGVGLEEGSPKFFAAVNSDTGALVWSHRADAYRYLNNPATIVGNDLYVQFNRYSWAFGDLSCLDTSSGELRWSMSTNYVVRNGHAYLDNKLFAINMNSEIIATDTTLESIDWSYRIHDDYIYDGYQIPAISSDAIYVGSDNNRFFSFTTDGAFRWSTDTGGSVTDCPAVAGGYVYSSNGAGYIFSLRASDGSIVWSYDMGTPSIQYEKRSPAIVDGYLYINPISSKMYAFENNATPEAPADLLQYQADGTTLIATGEWTSNIAIIKMNLSDPNNVETLYPELEVKLTTEAFTDSPNFSGEAAQYEGSPVLGVVTIEGLSNLEKYHWQARARDIVGYKGAWVSFGGNTETEIDFKSDTITPEIPSTLDAVALPASAPSYVSLNWNSATDEIPGSGLAGYYIYRSNVSGESYLRLNDELVTSTTSDDASVASDNNYFYVVTSKDFAGNESDYSNESSAPNLMLGKIMSIEAPVSGGYTGNDDDAVPGSSILYLSSYSNNGFAPAVSLVVVDKIPDYTDYQIGSATGEQISLITFSNNNGASFDYNPTGEAVDSGVTNIKWQCNDINAGSTAEVEFRVIIK